MKFISSALFILLCFSSLNLQAKDLAYETIDGKTYSITSLMSPCQCKQTYGGCFGDIFGYKLKEDEVYDDLTRKQDYDAYNRYMGKNNVPANCK